MRARSGRRWETRFGRFVSDVGVSNLRDALRTRGIVVTPQAVYHWIAATHAPSAVRRRALIEIARGRLRDADLSRTRKTT